MASPNSAVVVGGGASKARGRKGGKSGQKKQPQRGMGVAQLEKLRQQEQQFQLNNQFLPKQQPSEFNSLLQGFAHFTRLPPLHIHMLQDDPCEERRLRLSPAAALQPELPSIPNVDHHVFHLNTLSFKKKKIINGLDDLDAYLIPGRDTKYYLQQGLQVLAVHPKERNVVMEYGFFPLTPDSTNGTTTSTSSPASSSAYPAAAAVSAASIDLSLRL